jgi:hypothetical protein
MVWNSTWPNGAQSVKTNETTGVQNTNYIKTELNKDHYWDFGADEDGYHRWMNTVGTNDADTTLTTNCPLATNLDLVFFSRYKTPTEATVAAQQTTQPYFKNVGGDVGPWLAGVAQLLGMQACGWCRIVGGAITDKYMHNCTLTYGGVGRLTATFITALPTNNYLFFGGGVPVSVDTNDVMTCDCTPTAADKTTALVRFKTFLIHGAGGGNPTRELLDAKEVWFIVFGG